MLRLIVLRPGQQDVSPLTNVLDSQRSTDAEAAELFGMRWGEEGFYRSSKQTLQRRRLLSRTAATCLAEAQWTLLGLWLLGLLTISRLVSEGSTSWSSQWPRRGTPWVRPCGTAGPGAAPGAWMPPCAPRRRTPIDVPGAKRPAATRGRSGGSRPDRRGSNWRRKPKSSVLNDFLRRKSR